MVTSNRNRTTYHYGVNRLKEHLNMYNDRKYERSILLAAPHWINDGAVRRSARQLMRAWAKYGRPEYGLNSINSFCYYIANNPERVGGLADHN